MALKLPSRTVRLLKNEYRRAEGIALAQQWIDEQEGKINVVQNRVNLVNIELQEIVRYVQMFNE